MRKFIVIGGVAIFLFGVFVFVNAWNFGMMEKDRPTSIQNSGGPPPSMHDTQGLISGMVIMASGAGVIITGFILCHSSNNKDEQNMKNF